MLEEIASPRPLYSPYVTYSELSTGELAILRMARGAPALRHRFGAQLHHLQDRRGLGHARAGAAAQETGLLDPRAATLAVNLIPLFETIGDLQASGPVMDRLLALPGTGACSIRAP